MAVKEADGLSGERKYQNSVNYPDSDMGLRGDHTSILAIHHNIPNMLGQFTRILAKDNINIADLSNKSKAVMHIQ